MNSWYEFIKMAVILHNSYIASQLQKLLLLQWGRRRGGKGGDRPPTFESWELRKYQLNSINKTSSLWRSSGIG